MIADHKLVKSKYKIKWWIKLIILFLIIVYFIFKLGLIYYPKWYLSTNLKINIKKFEYVVENIGPYESYYESSLDEICNKQITQIFNCSHIKMIKYIEDVIIFLPDNMKKDCFYGLAYSDNEISEFYIADKKCTAEPIGDGWYYFIQ